MTATILARIAALKTTPVPALKSQWRELFGSEPPPYNRRFIESRLAYRIQELAFGGLRSETLQRLQSLGEQLDGGDAAGPHPRARGDRAHVASGSAGDGRHHGRVGPGGSGAV